MSVGTETAPVAAGSGSSDARLRRQSILLGVCCVAQFMVILDLSIVNVALPSIQAGLRFSSADLQWVVDAYAIMFAGFLMLAGRAGDLFGQRRTFSLALLVFAAASLGGGLAPTSGILIIARGGQGLGGALMAASSLAIITSAFEPGPARHRAIALWGAMNGAGGAAGTLLGGVITQELSWRWVMLINVPIGLVTLLVARQVVVDLRARKRRSFDFAGALVLTVGQLIAVYGGVTAGNDGWGSASALVPIAIGVVMLACFPLVEARAAEPLVPIKALTRPLKVINAIVLLLSAGLFPMWYVSSLYLQQVLALTPLDAGLIFLPMALAIFACASQAGRLVNRFGVRPVLGGGLILMACGLALLGRIGSGGSAVQYVMLPGLLTAMGIGFSIVPSTIAATHSAGAEQAGLASGLVNTARQVGGGLGLAILVSIATQYTSHLVGSQHGVDQALTDGFRVAYLIGAGLLVVAVVMTFTLIPSERGEAHRRGGAWVGVATLGIVAVFAAIEFGVPRSHAAPIGAYTLNNAYSFKSAPGLHPPKIQLVSATGGQPAAKLGGDIMLANFYDVTDPPIAGQSGPLILDDHLQPLWFAPVPTSMVASNLEVQHYHGAPVLTWWQGDVSATGLINSGEDVVVNDHYQRIATLKGSDGWVPTLHEMVIRGDDAWVTANKNVPADLSRYGGVNNGVLVDSAVQEYDLKTGKLLYTWDALDHIPLRDARTQPPPNGFPWDAYHINSVNLIGRHQFLTSMRNTWAAYMVNVRSGRIEWTLGGRESSFAIPAGSQFAWQHDVQMHSGGVITLFDDHCCDITGADQYDPPTGPTRGLKLKLDASNHTVTQLAQYSHGTTFHTRYMGNVQTLSNGNVLVGWGQVPYFSEFTRRGKLLFDGVMPTPDMSYRVYVQPWTGKPLSPPKGAATVAGGRTTVYASWNGATRVSAWRVLGTTSAGRRLTVATAPKRGFETTIPVRSSYRSFKVQALDAGGRVLGTSTSFAPAR